jgi:glycosyltransferase involved in cell wall biosynthesis
MRSGNVSVELTILMPCLNEAETLSVCIQKARAFLDTNAIAGEILIADNGSSDGSQQIAQAGGSRVIAVTERGYGAALMGGITHARGKYVIMGDADDSYDFSNLLPFVQRLRTGADLVMGNRFEGGIELGAMPFLHRYLGNPVLSAVGRLFFKIRVRDFHCGLRGFRRDSILGLKLRTTGMEFASEMIVRGALAELRIEEVPTTLSPDGRSRPPHLRTWRDGWRHLSFLLMYSPRWLFMYPGFLLLIAGVLGTAALFSGPLTIGAITFDIHTYIVACFLILLGAQAVGFAIIARRFAVSHGLAPPSRRYSKLIDALTLERVLIMSGILFLLGSAGLLGAVSVWAATGFGPLEYSSLLRTLILSTTVMSIGVQAAFTAFLSAIIEVPTR